MFNVIFSKLPYKNGKRPRKSKIDLQDTGLSPDWAFTSCQVGVYTGSPPLKKNFGNCPLQKIFLQGNLCSPYPDFTATCEEPDMMSLRCILRTTPRLPSKQQTKYIKKFIYIINYQLINYLIKYVE